jgi:protocatechuate 3,4-dioxygenase beta subunit
MMRWMLGVGLVGLVSMSAEAYAQGGATSASLSGRVTDSTGLILPGVTVTVINESTNQSRAVVTDASGFYHAYGLTPSTYTVTAELQVSPASS